jgi:hypothetical protein
MGIVLPAVKFSNSNKRSIAIKALSLYTHGPFILTKDCFVNNAWEARTAFRQSCSQAACCG